MDESKDKEEKIVLEKNIEDLIKIVETQKFLSDNLKFNATIYEGLNLIINKLNKFEQELEKIETTLKIKE